MNISNLQSQLQLTRLNLSIDLNRHALGGQFDTAHVQHDGEPCCTAPCTAGQQRRFVCNSAHMFENLARR